MGKVIAIRADGNSEIGFGHLMRTQALARQLEKRGAEVVFLTKNPENIKGYSLEVIDFNVGITKEDCVVEKILKKRQADMLIIDSYAYGQERLDRIAGLDLLSVYIDDMNLYEFNTDYLVNANLYAAKLDYHGKAGFLLGSEYLMMREEFGGLPSRKIRKQAQDVLISFGAADMENLTPWILKILFNYHKFYELNWHVVIGPVFRNLAEIEAMVRDKRKVFLHHSPDVKSLMGNCDISINAAGSTTYELAACGVPALLIAAADNQLRLAREADGQGFAIDLGWHSELRKEYLFDTLDRVIEDRAVRQAMAARGQDLIDGKGAKRLADILLNAMERP